MKAVKTWIRTKSGRLVEKTILMTKEDYEKLEQLKKEGKDPNEIFSKYMSMEDGDKIESWSKKEGRAMKVGCFSSSVEALIKSFHTFHNFLLSP